MWCIRQQLHGVHIEKPVLIYYHCFEKDNRRDGDNILSCATKFIQDSLTKTKVLQEDNRRCIPHFYHDVSVDKDNPRIEVTITELTPEQAKMKLRDLLNDLETGDLVDGNYIKLSRGLLDWEWYTDINTTRLFIHMLLKANWKDGNFKGTTIPRGSFVSSIGKLSGETGLQTVKFAQQFRI